MKITVMDGHRQRRKANAYKYPLNEGPSCSSSDNQALILKTLFTVPADTIPPPHPQPVPLITNPACKLELPHIQTIPLLEQFICE